MLNTFSLFRKELDKNNVFNDQEQLAQFDKLRIDLEQLNEEMQAKAICTEIMLLSTGQLKYPSPVLRTKIETYTELTNRYQQIRGSLSGVSAEEIEDIENMVLDKHDSLGKLKFPPSYQKIYDLYLDEYHIKSSKIEKTKNELTNRIDYIKDKYNARSKDYNTDYYRGGILILALGLGIPVLISSAIHHITDKNQTNKEVNEIKNDLKLQDIKMTLINEDLNDNIQDLVSDIVHNPQALKQQFLFYTHKALVKNATLDMLASVGDRNVTDIKEVKPETEVVAYPTLRLA